MQEDGTAASEMAAVLKQVFAVTSLPRLEPKGFEVAVEREDHPPVMSLLEYGLTYILFTFLRSHCMSQYLA